MVFVQKNLLFHVLRFLCLVIITWILSWSHNLLFSFFKIILTEPIISKIWPWIIFLIFLAYLAAILYHIVTILLGKSKDCLLATENGGQMILMQGLICYFVGYPLKISKISLLQNYHIWASKITMKNIYLHILCVMYLYKTSILHELKTTELFYVFLMFFSFYIQLLLVHDQVAQNYLK